MSLSLRDDSISKEDVPRMAVSMKTVGPWIQNLDVNIRDTDFQAHFSSSHCSISNGSTADLTFWAYVYGHMYTYMHRSHICTSWDIHVIRKIPKTTSDKLLHYFGVTSYSVPARVRTRELKLFLWLTHRMPCNTIYGFILGCGDLD